MASNRSIVEFYFREKERYVELWILTGTEWEPQNKKLPPEISVEEKRENAHI